MINPSGLDEFLSSDMEEPPTDEKKYIYLDVGQYVSLAKEFLSQEHIEGVVTERICECVFGYLVGKKNIFAFHFYRENDPDHLLAEILKTFAPDDELQIFLVNGGFNLLAYPWNLTKRNLIIDDRVHMEASCSQMEVDAVKEILTHLNKSDGFNTSISDFDYVDLIVKCADKYKKDFFKIDFKKLKEEIKSRNFKVRSGDSILKFDMKNPLDFVAIQNLNKIYYILAKLHEKGMFFHLEQCWCCLGGSFKTTSNYHHSVIDQVHIIEETPKNLLKNTSNYLNEIKNYYFKSEGKVKSRNFLFKPESVGYETATFFENVDTRPIK